MHPILREIAKKELDTGIVHSDKELELASRSCKATKITRFRINYYKELLRNREYQSLLEQYDYRCPIQRDRKISLMAKVYSAEIQRIFER